MNNVLRELPNVAADRKQYPIVTGVVDYFPLAIAEIARLSKIGNDQHNPGQPLHWDRSKSADHADCLGRHLVQRGTIDTDGVSHTTKVAWRALALLQEELEAEAGFVPIKEPVKTLHEDRLCDWCGKKPAAIFVEPKPHLALKPGLIEGGGLCQMCFDEMKESYS
jgi:hypothetical protein